MTDDSPEQQCHACTDKVSAGDRLCPACGAELVVRRTPEGDPPEGRDRVIYDLGPIAGVSDRGCHRTRNEDAMGFALVSPPDRALSAVAVVCDGVASSQRGEQAAQLSADTALASLVAAMVDNADPVEATELAVSTALTKVADLAQQDFPGTAPSCTYVSAVVTAGLLTVGWVGDSRAYWLPGTTSNGDRAHARRLTTDDTVAAQLVAAGMAESDAVRVYNAHALSQWIGADARDVRPHVTTVRLGDEAGVLVLCSDGLWNYLPDADTMAAAVRSVADLNSPATVATDLVATALNAGGRDNITVVAVGYPLAAAVPASPRDQA